MSRGFIFILTLLTLAMGSATAQPPDVAPANEARYQKLIAQLRCVICQNRSIAESDAPLASDMRAIVARQMRDGRSDEEIKNYLVQRYGEFVLYNPRFSAATWALWLGPALLLLLAGLVVLLLWRRTSRRQEPAPPNAAEIAKILDKE